MSKFSLKDLVKEEVEATAPKTTLWEPISIETKEPVNEFSSKTSRIGSLSSLNEDLKENKTVVKSGWTPIVQKTEEKPKVVFPSAKPSNGFKALKEIYKEDLAPVSAKLPELYERIELPPIVEFKKTAEEERDELVQSFTEQIKVQEQNRSIEPARVEPIEEPVAEEAIVEPDVEETPKEKTLIDKASEFITKELKTEENSYQQPEVPLTAQNFKEVTRKLKFLEEWISKISLAGPGGGAGDVINLDHPVKVVSSNYTFTRRDYYVGVNSTSSVTLTLPDAIGFPGRVLVVKDESGNCSNNPITVNGTVDNDPGGFILQMDNGGIQMIYREGWRII